MTPGFVKHIYSYVFNELNSPATVSQFVYTDKDKGKLLLRTFHLIAFN